MGQDIKSPLRFPSVGSQIRNLAFGKHHHALVTDDGNLFVWGHSFSWELGVGLEQTTLLEPTKLQMPKPVKQVVCGHYHTMALTESGEIWTWGWGGNQLKVGALGHGEFKDCPFPKQIPPFSEAPIVQISAGDFHNLALDADGKVYAWGQGQNGVSSLSLAFFENIASSNSAPCVIDFFHESKIRIAFISAGSSHSGAISDEGVLYTWGKNDSGQIGSVSVSLDLYSCDPVPVQTHGLTGEIIRQFVAGVSGSICINDKHQVKDWGDKRHHFPETVRGDNDFFLSVKVVQVAAGDKFFAAVDDEGRLYTWGSAASGCLVNIQAPTGFMSKAFSKFNPSPALVEGFGPDSINGRVVRIFAANHNIAVITTQSG